MIVYDNKSNEYSLFMKNTDILFPDIPKDKILIYDIDTTSFEAANGCVFMIGVLFFDNTSTGGELVSHHYFSEKISEELTIIETFLDFSTEYTICLSYKGESFDIPFISKRLFDLKKQNSGNKDLCDRLSALYTKLQSLRSRSYDLYNEIHAVKAGLNFTSSKLDSLRKILGQSVPERISGENISKFYVEHIAAMKLKALQEISCKPENTGYIREYVRKPIPDELAHISSDSGDRFLDNILARNLENMEAVLYIMKLSHLFVMRRGSFDVTIGSVPTVTFSISERDFHIDIPVEIQTLNLKIFYANFKDYYYFPSEDMAIHKSIAEFTGTGSKKKATSKTAYANVSGDFIRIPRAYATSDTQKASNKYKTCYEAEEYYMPVQEVIRLNNDSIKEMAYYTFLEYAGKNIQDIIK